MGPLNGFKIVEIAGIGPSQLCGRYIAVCALENRFYTNLLEGLQAKDSRGLLTNNSDGEVMKLCP